MDGKKLLIVNNLEISLEFEKNYIKIINNVNFRLNEGEVLALVGESGCGKTVTSRSLVRLLPKELKITSGNILFDFGKNGNKLDITKLGPKSRSLYEIRGKYVGMIFQEPMSSFSPVHTIGDQILEPIIIHENIPKKEALDRVIELLAKVGIPDPKTAINKYPHEFSGGMRQRAMIARALACNPTLLIADEPTTALDVTIQAQIINLLKELQEEYGMAVIFITHNLGVVAQIASRVIIMYMGRIVEEGDIIEVFSNPKHPYTICLINAIPRLENLSKRRKLEPILGDVPNIYERPRGCEFHPRCKSMIRGKCDRYFPKAIKISNQHSVCCYLYE